MKKSKYLVLAALAAFALGGCTPAQGGGEDTPETPTVTVTSVTVSKSSETLTAGETLQLTATVNPVGAAQTVTWASTDTNVATVSASGLVTAYHSGEAVITATAVGTSIKGTCTITVEAVAATDWTEAQKANMTELLGVDVPFLTGFSSDWEYKYDAEYGYIELVSPETDGAEITAFMTALYTGGWEPLTSDYSLWVKDSPLPFSLAGVEGTFDGEAAIAIEYDDAETENKYVFYIDMYLEMVTYESSTWPSAFVTTIVGSTDLPGLSGAEKYYYYADYDSEGELCAYVTAEPATGESLDITAYLSALEAAEFDVEQYTGEGSENYDFVYIAESANTYVEILGYQSVVYFSIYEGGVVPPTPVEGSVVITAQDLQVQDSTQSSGYAKYAGTQTVNGLSVTLADVMPNTYGVGAANVIQLKKTSGTVTIVNSENFKEIAIVFRTSYDLDAAKPNLTINGEDVATSVFEGSKVDTGDYTTDSKGNHYTIYQYSFKLTYETAPANFVISTVHAAGAAYLDSITLA